MLSIVSTPIGNLKDITLRAKETLEACDTVVCEDTRVTGTLLKLLELQKKPLLSFHGYSDKTRLTQILKKLEAGEHLVLVSDAGTPGISDPGYALVSEAVKMDIKVEVIPGPSAFLAALSASGLPINQFVYLGFLPLKKGRKTLITNFAQEERTIVFYESVHRIDKTLSEIEEALRSQPERPVVIARELTKMHEEVIRTTVGELNGIVSRLVKKGEFVIVIGGSDGDVPEDEEDERSS